MLEAERKFRKVKGYRELPALHRKLNPSLTQQAQVAYGAVLRERHFQLGEGPLRLLQHRYEVRVKLFCYLMPSA